MKSAHKERRRGVITEECVLRDDFRPDDVSWREANGDLGEARKSPVVGSHVLQPMSCRPRGVQEAVREIAKAWELELEIAGELIVKEGLGSPGVEY